MQLTISYKVNSIIKTRNESHGCKRWANGDLSRTATGLGEGVLGTGAKRGESKISSVFGWSLFSRHPRALGIHKDLSNRRSFARDDSPLGFISRYSSARCYMCTSQKLLLQQNFPHTGKQGQRRRCLTIGHKYLSVPLQMFIVGPSVSRTSFYRDTSRVEV